MIRICRENRYSSEPHKLASAGSTPASATNFGAASHCTPKRQDSKSLPARRAYNTTGNFIHVAQRQSAASPGGCTLYGGVVAGSIPVVETNLSRPVVCAQAERSAMVVATRCCPEGHCNVPREPTRSRFDSGAGTPIYRLAAWEIAADTRDGTRNPARTRR